jgi:uncharacterized integral membrane protein (TIGR00697 family)
VANGSTGGSAAAPVAALSTGQVIYVWLCGVFVASLLVADVIGIKLFRLELPFPVFGINAVEHTCGMLTFPVTFLLTDLINEYYGKKGARRATLVAFVMAAFAFGVMNVALAMPRLDAPYNVDEGAFRAVFANARIMYVASLCAFLIGQFCDIAIFGIIKRATGGRMIWLRATGSTLFSQAIDSFFVSWIAFGVGRQLLADASAPAAPFGDILKIAATGYVLKGVVAVAITPLIYAGHGVMRKRFGMVPMPVA